MKVLTLQLSLMTQHEVLGYLKRVNSILSGFPIVSGQPIGDIRLSFLEIMNYFDEVLKPPTRSEYTKRIQQIRSIRLDQWSGLRNDIRSKCKIADETIAFPAEKASTIIDRYGNLRSITSVACDAAIENILQDLKAEISENDLKKITISDWMNLLSKTNEEYKNLDERRMESEIKTRPGVTLEARKKAISGYHELVNDLQYLNRRGTDSEQETTSNFIELINQLIKKIKPILKSRSTRRKNRHQPEEENPTPDTRQELLEILNENEPS